MKFLPNKLQNIYSGDFQSQQRREREGMTGTKYCRRKPPTVGVQIKLRKTNFAQKYSQGFFSQNHEFKPWCISKITQNNFQGTTFRDLVPSLWTCPPGRKSVWILASLWKLGGKWPRNRKKWPKNSQQMISGAILPISGPFSYILAVITGVHTRCIVFTRGVCLKIADFMRFNGFLVEFPQRTGAAEKIKNLEKRARKVNFSETRLFPMHLVCTQLTDLFSRIPFSFLPPLLATPLPHVFLAPFSPFSPPRKVTARSF